MMTLDSRVAAWPMWRELRTRPARFMIRGSAVASGVFAGTIMALLIRSPNFPIIVWGPVAGMLLAFFWIVVAMQGSSWVTINFLASTIDDPLTLPLIKAKELTAKRVMIYGRAASVRRMKTVRDATLYPAVFVVVAAIWVHPLAAVVGVVVALPALFGLYGSDSVAPGLASSSS